MIKVKITAESVQDFRRQLEQLLSMSGGIASATPDQVNKVEKEAKVRNLKPAPEKEEKVVPGPGESEGDNLKEDGGMNETLKQDNKEQNKKPSNQITMDDLRDATIAQNEKGNKDKVKKVLSSFGAARLGELAESDYANYLAKLKAL